MAELPKLPFAEVAAACLRQAMSLVEEWCPGGHYAGPEYKALNPMRGDRKIGSFSVNTSTGEWGDFATDDAGSDLVSLYAYLFHQDDQGAAVRELADHFGIAVPDTRRETAPRGRKAGRKSEEGGATPGSSPAAPDPAEPVSQAEKPPRTYWVPVFPVPEDAPAPPVAHPHRGKPSRVFTYRAPGDGRVNGYVCRFPTSDGGKDDIPLCYAQHSKSGKFDWRWMAFGDVDRPLFGLDQAAAKPQATLFFVEGEKCAEAAEPALPDLVVMTWQGGCNAVAKGRFGELAERPKKKAILWPDCDAKREKLSKEEKAAGVDPLSKPLLPEAKQPGTKAMAHVADRLLAMGYQVWRVRIPAPGERPDGWDIADAIELDGWSSATLTDFLREPANLERLLPPAPEAADAPPGPALEGISTPSGADAGKAEKKPWVPDLIWGRDSVRSCMANAYQMLRHFPEWKGVLAFNEFSGVVEKRKTPPLAGGIEGEWEGTDDSRTALWLAHRVPDWGFTPSSDIVAEAVEVLARENRYHPVREYFDSLVWDGIPRLENWLTDHLDVEESEYTRRAGKWWLMGAVKRIYEPGAKFDYCLVLMGSQGRKKSTAFAALAGDWFGDTDLDLNHKDSMSALRGKLIYEIAELGSFARSEEKRQKSFLSRRVDEYRPVYGRREIKAPRQLVFCGTTNEDVWNKDPTGGRRFWPVRCLIDEIDVEKLVAIRDQLWAEAVALVKAGERYWPSREEQAKLFDPEQLSVEHQDDILEPIHDWVYARSAAFSAYEVAVDCLKLDAAKLTRDMQTRIGIALKKLGCRRIEKRNGMTRYWYEPPTRNEASSTSGVSAFGDKGGDDVGF